MVTIIIITIIISNQMWLSLGLSFINGFILMGLIGFIHGIINGIYDMMGYLNGIIHI